MYEFKVYEAFIEDLLIDFGKDYNDNPILRHTLSHDFCSWIDDNNIKIRVANCQGSNTELPERISFNKSHLLPYDNLLDIPHLEWIDIYYESESWIFDSEEDFLLFKLRWL